MYHNNKATTRYKKERKNKAKMEETTKANQKIRKAVKDSGVYYWQIAERLGITCWTLSVWMRHEMPEAKQERILQLIREESEQMRNGIRA